MFFNKIVRSTLYQPAFAFAKFSSSTSTEISYINSFKEKEEKVILDKSREDKISCIFMNARSNKNALSSDFVKQFHTICDDLLTDTESKAVVLGSLVKNVFCSGADLKERAQVADQDTPALVEGLRLLFTKLSRIPVPVIAAIDGAALGGGLEMALGCDIRYASDSSKTKIGLIETHWALHPGAGGTQRLPRIIGEANAKELIFCAKRLSGKEAFKYGVVNGVVSTDDAKHPEHVSLLHSLSVAKEIANKGPIAVRMAKRAITFGLEEKLDEGLNIEGQCYEVVVPTEDRKEGMKAFAEKRNPIYTGK